MNLLETLTGQLTGGSALGAISKLLGENEASTKTGLGAALPILLGSVIKSGSTPSGASGLLDMLKSGGHDGSALGNIAGLLGGGSATNSFMSSGGGIISSLLGDKVGGVVNLISGLSGLKGGSISSLLNLAAPFLMGTIGKAVFGGGGGVSALTSLLSSQAKHVQAALPAGASNLLGFSNLGGNIGGNIQNVAEEAGAGFGKFLPWILGLVAAAAAFYFWKSCETPKVETPVAVEKAKDAAVEMKDSMASKIVALGDAIKLALPGGINLDIPSGSLEDQMATFIQSTDTISKKKWFDFDRLTFETGKSTMKPESAAQLANVATIMKVFPNVKIKIGGYTDNVGNAASNMKLSGERAKNVMAELVKLGTAATRMEAEGYGDKEPVASNDTEEGRAKNRRISMSVRAK
jgi:OmpA-OmpF porin, OOP family